MIDAEKLRRMRNGHLVNSIRWCERTGQKGTAYHAALLEEKKRRDENGWDDGRFEEVQPVKRFVALVEIEIEATSVEDAEKGIGDELAKNDFPNGWRFITTTEIEETES